MGWTGRVAWRSGSATIQGFDLNLRASLSGHLSSPQRKITLIPFEKLWWAANKQTYREYRSIGRSCKLLLKNRQRFTDPGVHGLVAYGAVDPGLRQALLAESAILLSTVPFLCCGGDEQKYKETVPGKEINNIENKVSSILTRCSLRSWLNVPFSKNRIR